MRRQDFNEVSSHLIGFVAIDDYFGNFLGVHVAQRPFNQVALFMNQCRCLVAQGCQTDLVPAADKIVVVADDVGLGFVFAGGADNHRHVTGQRQFTND